MSTRRPAATDAAPRGLVERGAELAALHAAIDAARAGRGTCVLVEGPPGIGKTTLLADARDHAAAHGIRVLDARGSELEQGFPHGVARQLLERTVHDAGDDLLAGTAALAAPALGLGRTTAGPEPTEFAVAHGLFWLLSNLADRGAVAILVDDAQWADEPSLRFLLHLLRRLDGLPVALLLASRPLEGAASALLADLAADRATTVLAPALLSDAGSSRLLHDELDGAVGPAFALAAHGVTGGNPFLLTELLEAARSDGIRTDDAGAERLATLTSRGVSRSVLLRLHGLPVEATELARAVATLGPGVEVRHAAALAGLPAGEAVALADQLAARHVLARGPRLSVIHPMIGEAIRDDIAPGERSALHGRAARVLAADGQSADRVAGHLELTGRLQDPWVAETLRTAASIARERGALDAAQRWLLRALDEGVAPPRAALLHELGEAEWLAGRPTEAIAHLREAVALTADPEAAARTRLVLARALASTLDVPGANAVLAASTEASRATALLTLAERATYALLTGTEVRAAGDALAPFADVAGEDVAELLVLCSIAGVHLQIGAADDAARFARRGLDGDRLLTAGEGDAFPYSGAVITLTMCDEHDEARAILDRSLDDAVARGSTAAYSYACGGSALLSWLAGDVPRCEAMARQALEAGIPVGFAHPVLCSYLALALVERGELDEAERVVAQTGVGPGLPPLTHAAHAFYARARLRRAQGRVQDALTDLLEEGRRAEAETNLLPYPPWRVDAAECLLELGDRERATALLAEHTRHAERWGTASAIGVALRGRALAAQGTERIVLLERAEARLAASPARLDHARTLVDLGAARRAAGARTEAQRTLRDAVELAGRCGATVLRERAHAELVAAGARPRRLQFSGVDSLTASERRVAELATDGRSNAQIAQALFVTRSTVEKHLSQVYRKLGIGSREHLAAALEPPLPPG